EIIEYLGVPSPKQTEAADAVRLMADDEGHFAPYPGGGGCYDYDAVFMLTPQGRMVSEDVADLLMRSAITLLAEQNDDGGYAESQYVRPRSFKNLARVVSHVRRAVGQKALFKERC